LATPSLVLAITPTEIVPNSGGLVVYKEEAYLDNKLAGAMLFSKAIQRSPTTTQYIGAGDSALVPSDGLIASFVAEEINVAELSGPQLNEYRARVDRLVELEKINPRVAGVIAPVVEKMKSNIGMSIAHAASTSGGEKNETAGSGQTNQREVKQPRLKSLTTIDGDTYQNTTYKSSDDQKVAFLHSDGVARVLWEKLKKEDQLAWGYDSEKEKINRLAREKAAEEKRKADELAQQKILQEKLKEEEETRRAKELAQQKIAEEKKENEERQRELSDPLRGVPVQDGKLIGPKIKGVQLGMDIRNARVGLAQAIEGSGCKVGEIECYIPRTNSPQKYYRFKILKDHNGKYLYDGYSDVMSDSHCKVIQMRLCGESGLVNKIFKAGAMGYKEFIQEILNKYNIPEVNPDDSGQWAKHTDDDGALIQISVHKDITLFKTTSAAERFDSFN